MGGPMQDRSAGEPASRGGEDGQALPLLAAVVLLAMLGCAGLVRLGTALADRARARTAADAAALAGVRDGEDMAARVAADDHGELQAYVARDGRVEVTVRVGGATATARADRRW